MCCESERELDQITKNLGNRLTAIPTTEEINEERKEESGSERKEALVMFMREEGRRNHTVGFSLCNSCWVM